MARKDKITILTTSQLKYYINNTRATEFTDVQALKKSTFNIWSSYKPSSRLGLSLNGFVLNSTESICD